MAKINFYNLPDSEKSIIFQQIANAKKMSPFAVEKDWWVVQTLGIIFEMEVSAHILFKGGTSLSKAWKLIERFSEDIDFAIDRDFFGFEGELKKSQRTDLRKVSSMYVATTFFNHLKTKFVEKGFANVQLEVVEEPASDKDRIINVFYPNIIQSPGYIKPKVQIEIGCRSLREPYTIMPISSMVDEAYSDFEFVPIQVPTVNPERTFLEKIFLLHEEFQRAPEKMRVDRQTRHLYDLCKLSKTDFANNALSNKELYETIVEHRYKFNRVGGVNYNLHQPQTINPIPIPDVIKAWESDYSTMLEQMIYEENPLSFDALISELTQLKTRINSSTWKFDKVFPIN